MSDPTHCKDCLDNMKTGLQTHEEPTIEVCSSCGNGVCLVHLYQQEDDPPRCASCERPT